MANQVKSYFKVPTITQIRKNKDPIIIESKSQLVKILLELSNSYEDELKEKYLVINYPTIPKKFKLNKKYEKRGKLALYELKNIEDSRTVSDCLFLELGKMRRPEEVICFGLKFDIGKILTNDELEQTQEKKANILLRPADLIRAKKLESLVAKTRARGKTGKSIYQKHNNYYINIITPAYKLNERSHIFQIYNIPRYNVEGQLDLTKIKFFKLSKNDDWDNLSGNEDINERDAYLTTLTRKRWNAQQIFGLKLVLEKLKKEEEDFAIKNMPLDLKEPKIHFDKINPIFPISQRLVNAYDILTKHTIIKKSPENNQHRRPKLVEIDNSLMLFLGDFAEKRDFRIIRSVNINGLAINPKDLDFEIFYQNKIKTTWGYLRSEHYMAHEKQKHTYP